MGYISQMVQGFAHLCIDVFREIMAADISFPFILPFKHNGLVLECIPFLFRKRHNYCL